MIYIREITRDDLEKINAWRNDKSIVDQLGGSFRFINLETDVNWFASYMSNRNNQLRCAICLESTNQMVGMINLLQIDPISRNAELAIMIGDKTNQNKGIGTKAIVLMLEHAFDNLNLHRVYLSVIEHNERAIKVYERIGLIREGVMRDATFKNGTYHNMILMSILAREFRK